MKKRRTGQNKVHGLRQQADELLKGQPKADLKKLPAEEAEHLIHELRVHQIELEMQNDELRRSQEELEASRSKYADLYDFAPVSYFTFDKNGLILEANLTGAGLLGFERSRLIKKPFSIFVEKDYQNSFYLHRKKVFDVSDRQTCEIKLKKKDGAEFYALMESIQVEDSLGNKSCRTSIIDMTGRKRTEKTLLLHSEIMKNMAEGVNLIRLEDGIIVYANPRSEKMFGYDPGEMIGKYVTIVNAPGDKTPVEMNKAIVDFLVETGEWHGEVENIRKDGTRFWRYTNISLFDHPDYGRVMVSVHTDITKRKKVEEALRESEVRYVDLYDNAPDMYISVDAGTGRILQCNQTLTTELGHTKAEIIGCEIFDLYHPDSVAEAKKTFSHFVETGEVHDKELQVKRKDGTVIDVSLNSSAVYDEEGRILYSRFSWRDITDKKLLERQLLHAQKMETVGTLAGGVAHDFNNILTVIIGTVSILKRRFSKEDPLQPYFGQIDEAAESAANLTRNLLAFSRKQENCPTLMDVSEIIRKQEKFLLRVIEEDIEFSTKLADKELFVMMDFNQMEQVFMNLAANARDAMPKGGTFTISTEYVTIDNEYIRSHGYGTAGEYARITISDTGVGMDEHTKARIFEPFYTTKDVDKGTGLGLSIVYGIIKQHKGYINVRSGPGEGTTFSIYLPLVKSPAEDSAGEKRIESLPQVKVTETVLVAEDSETLRNLIAFALTEAGYKVIAAEDGEDALNKFMDNSDSIQLVLLDLIMPKKNGKEVYDAIKKIKTNIKFLFFSGYSEDILPWIDIIKEGIWIIPKPIKPDVLLRKIREELYRV
jgi:two-component system cell cycle sensor histidine kinase/response regulator CckA